MQSVRDLAPEVCNKFALGDHPVHTGLNAYPATNAERALALPSADPAGLSRAWRLRWNTEVSTAAQV